MSFVKKLATADDQKEFKEKFGTSLSVGDSFVVNTERDCLLHSPRQDRWDMGGTTNTYWHFTYQNQNLIVACKMGATDLGPKKYEILIISIRKLDCQTEITVTDDNFIANFSDAYHTYQKFRDLSPEIEMESLNTFRFQFAGGLS